MCIIIALDAQIDTSSHISFSVNRDININIRMVLSLVQRVPPHVSYAWLQRATAVPWYRAAPALVVRLATADGKLQLTGVGERFARYYDREARSFVDIYYSSQSASRKMA
jgi:hypothetical protein